MKLPVELLQAAEAEFPKTTADISNIRTTHASTAAVDLDGLAHFELRRSMIAMSAREDFDPAFERYLGTNDLLPVNYLLTGFMRSRSVGRIKYFDRVKHKTAYATGFMVTPDLMMTNHHVFPVANAAEFAAFADDAVIEFGYEFDLRGKRGEPVAHALDPETFLHTSKALDLALVAVRQIDMSGNRQLSDQGYLILNGRIGKAGTADFATIIQHADGEDKQVALRNNEILANDLADVLIYKSDTAPGSSGAPVFNNEWQVIALHSAGVAKKDGQGNYLDKDEQIIPVEHGQIEEARIVWLSNRGIRISTILAYLRSPASTVALHPLINVFNSPAYSDSRPFKTAPVPKVHDELMVKPSEGTPTAPALAPAPFGPIEIRLSIGGGQAFTQTFASPAQAAPHLMVVEAEKKLEDEQDYSTCMGFEEEFMGIRIPMPVPSEKLRKKLARLRDAPASMVLKYHHYSTMQHAVRRVPAFYRLRNVIHISA
ncbi:serine protease [Comamonas sp. MYb21]|uniref:trypsin-like serine peptidase n=1 Tax=Comamonas sp. MYb21 TaxID=1848648 RepID=UPI00309B61F0